ncbi:PREDICTED: pectinesterase/pectinesterase inhibitor 18-like isoform X3 [Camelina sativa]|uniref:Pectinesterase n=1 Tax=Camelina sativa TaxID=90675 RepID=A0ABM1QVI5_CAMSA|nr:PREDICTED: pectinesterase/pectinesterase inhibitor 18-like isoform X1 [Camelina sativa]XP_019090772.1 PREDICTED: pectinesterase/pectinesterase inhibitor 18-like isoform X2 [Camelina sativa]XP_019090773.1 PREDICTED: pectinesterase/pectinesterase inhibitor 18-like isoform X3 [Camelina sativa]
MSNSNQPLLSKPKSLKHKNLCLVLSFAAILGSAAFFAAQLIYTNDDSVLTPSQICHRTHDQDSCQVLLSEFTMLSLSKLNRLDLLHVFLKNSVWRLERTMTMVKEARTSSNGVRDEAVLADCEEMMDVSKDRMVNSMEQLRGGNLNFESYSNVHTWLSSVLTNYMTCLDTTNEPRVKPQLEDLVSRARVALAIFVSVLPARDDLKMVLFDHFPSWLTALDRELLESAPKTLKVNANVVVAKDGSGKYKTVNEAVAAAPENSNSRYVIYVKKGVYKETIDIGKKKKNLMLVGDGKDATIITGSLNVVDGSTTFRSATIAANGDGFMAQDLWIQNTAGPAKHQAVALRVSADQTVINRCRIDAYQDTLYTHTLRQFYRDSFITGTVDFIFGNSAVVFQNCDIVARKPGAGQKNMVTAQGREDQNQNTAISIQRCKITASSDLAPVKGSVKTFLGRPWKLYSRTVIMQTFIDNHIDPAGWFPWDGEFALSTLYYGEYANSGPGADTSKRVKWKGFKVIRDSKEAEQFTVAKLIQGGLWLKPTGVTYQEWL